MKKFPWIRKHLRGEPIDEVHFSEIDLSFLQYALETIECPDGMDMTPDEMIFFLDEKGDLVVAETTERFRKKFFLFGPSVRVIAKYPGIADFKSSVESVRKWIAAKTASEESDVALERTRIENEIARIG
jgi:hypothetical protein